MKGYSFRSLTDLVLKIFKTKVNAGIGLSGGGSLEADRTLTVNYGTTAGTATQGNDSRVVNAASNAIVNAKEAALEAKKADKTITITADTGLSGGGTLAANRSLSVKYGSSEGTAAQGNDSRLSNSREWTAATISQAETEAGTATTRRAFTAQRVRQAIVAWFNGVSGTIGRTILGRSTSAQVRGDLGLGTAATRDVGTSTGSVVEVGAGGWLGSAVANSYISGYPQNFSQNISQIYRRESTDGQVTAYAASIHFAAHDTWGRMRVRYDSPVAWIEGGDVYSGWTAELIHTGNILTTTGQSTLYPMTQKAVTDALNTKANTSTQVIAGTGLSGGGNLTASRTLNVNYGTAAGTAAQGNDTRITGAAQKSANLSDLTNVTTARSILGVPTGDWITTVGLISDNPDYPYLRRTSSGELIYLANRKYVDDSAIGVGQTWQNVTGSRDAGTVYTNTTGRPIQVSVTLNAVDAGLEVVVGSVVVARCGQTGGAGNDINFVQAIIPTGGVYKINLLKGHAAGLVWSELC